MLNFNFINKDFIVRIWEGEVLGNYIAVDTETTMKPFHMTPEMVTCQAYGGGDIVYYIPKDRTLDFFNTNHGADFIFHNASFDLDVLEAHIGREDIYHLLDSNSIIDTSIIFRLLHLATVGTIPHRYNLNLLTKKFLHTELTGKGEEQCGFTPYLDQELTTIPHGLLTYGAKDVIATYHVYFAMLPLVSQYDTYGKMLSHDIQVKGEYALLHIYKNGIGFDLKNRDNWIEIKNKELQLVSEKLGTWGWVRGTKGIKKRFEDIMVSLGIADNLPRTDDGSISSKREDLEEYVNIPFINDYLQFIELEKATTFVRGIESDRVHPRYNSLVNTGRTSCSKPNFQQLPRVGGIREMFKASAGSTLIITDYSTLELCTLAQVLKDKYNESTMGDLINEGRDLHRYYASVLHNIDEKAITKSQRQEAKAANFGFPGGLGTTTFRKFSAGYGLDLSESKAQIMKDAWFSAFPEMREYLKNEDGHVFTRTGRRRGNTTYCAEKNTPFQGLAADGCKLALYNMDKAGYKIVGFVHDEIITEVASADAEKLLQKQELIMVGSMQAVVPDVKISVESQISEVYCK